MLIITINILQCIAGMVCLYGLTTSDKQKAHLTVGSLTLIILGFLFYGINYWITVSAYYVPHPFYDGAPITMSIMSLVILWIWFYLYINTKNNTLGGK